jgi:hypothetical protein
MSDPLVAATAEFALLFGMPALVLAVVCHVLLPRRAMTIAAALLAAELVLIGFDVEHENAGRGTNLEMLAVPGVLLGIAAGNLLAIPIARWLRSLVNPSARQ